MQNLLSELKELLKKDERLMVEDELLKNKVIELALKLDEDLIRLLLSHARLRQHFFAEVDSVLVFDKEKFLQFASNKDFLPDSYTAFSIKIGLTDDGGRTYVSRHRDVVVAWPYKDCVLEGGQTEEDAKRDEIFWNVTLAPDDIDRLLDPKVFTNFRRINADGEHAVKEIPDTDNLIIKGNNLLALHSLLPRFRGRVKLIYIDPPYNTGNDSFGYNDRFNHSTWLTFMKNRLEVARGLLRNDGVICIQISDIGVSRLRLLLDEIFGVDNFINKITVRTRAPSGFKTVNVGVFEAAEYILIYGKEPGKWEYHPQYVETEYDSNYNRVILNIDDVPEAWKYESIDTVVAKSLDYENAPDAKEILGPRAFREKVAELALKHSNSVFRLTTINRDAGKDTRAIKKISLATPVQVFVVEREDYPDRFVLNGQEITFYSKKVKEIDGELKPTTMLTNIWMDIPWEGIAGEGGVRLKRGKKPEKLIRRIIDMSTDPGEIVLDFFLGSGTTTAVAHKMGCQYIGIEQLEYGENDSIVRLKNVIGGDQSGISKAVGWQGGGDFVYCELMQWNARYMDQVQAAQTAEELQALWEALQAKAFLSYKVKFDEFDQHAKEFAQLTLPDQKRFLLGVLDKNHLYVNLSEIDDEDYQVSDEDKRLNRQFYSTEQN